MYYDCRVNHIAQLIALKEGFASFYAPISLFITRKKQP